MWDNILTFWPNMFSLLNSNGGGLKNSIIIHYILSPQINGRFEIKVIHLIVKHQRPNKCFIAIKSLQAQDFVYVQVLQIKF